MDHGYIRMLLQCQSPDWPSTTRDLEWNGLVHMSLGQLGDKLMTKGKYRTKKASVAAEDAKYVQWVIQHTIPKSHEWMPFWAYIERKVNYFEYRHSNLLSAAQLAAIEDKTKKGKAEALDNNGETHRDNDKDNAEKKTAGKKNTGNVDKDNAETVTEKNQTGNKENAAENQKIDNDSDSDLELVAVGSSPKKARLASLEERLAAAETRLTRIESIEADMKAKCTVQ
jgi:hypothetical protein